MIIRHQQLEVDVREELDPYEWGNAKWERDKLIANSPFREEKTPSFFVRLKEGEGYEEGSWHDSGGDYFRSGKFVRLLAFLRNEEEEDVENYLLEKYGGDIGYQHLKLTLDFEENKYHLLSEHMFDSLEDNFDYLKGRGIKESVQQLCRIKYDPETESVAIPWFDVNGNLAKIKYRSTKSKFFWYSDEGIPIRNLVYGLDLIYKKNLKYAAIVESETDALTFLSHGIPAIALGGATINDVKRDLIVKSPIERLYIATDNDEVGQRIRRKLISVFSPYKQLYTCDIPKQYKDINDIKTTHEIRNLISNAYKVDNLFLKF